MAGRTAPVLTRAGKTAFHLDRTVRANALGRGMAQESGGRRDGPREAQGEAVALLEMLDDLSTKKSATLVEELYTAGAAKVLAADIEEDMKGNQTADKLVVALPTNARQREAILELCAHRKLAFSPEHETGQSHLAILFG